MTRNMRINIRYQTDAERIRRVLPPPLEMDDSPEVITDWLLIESGNQPNVFVPGPYYESGTFIAARYGGHSGMWEISIILNQDWGRHRGRELQDLTKKDGIITIERHGDIVRASLTRRGKILTHIETYLTDQIQHPRFWLREFGYTGFRFRYCLNPDWCHGPLGVPEVELWRMGGSDYGYPTTMIAGENLPMACDISRTRFELVEASAIDPLCEFPPRKILGVTYYEGETRLQRSRQDPSGVREAYHHHRLAKVDAVTFEPWALYKYDRPMFDGKQLVPTDWPNATSAFKLTPEGIQAYRSRQAIVLSPINVLSIEYLIDSAVHHRTLPSGCDPGQDPRILILALQVERSDVSTVPFNELWLFSRCFVGGKKAWYALANTVGVGGDVIYGRDVFGYPSKQGRVNIEMKDKYFNVVGNRLDRDYLLVKGKSSGRTIQSLNRQMLMVGLKAYPIPEDHRFRGRLVLQPWEVESFNSFPVQLDDLTIEMPDTSSPGTIGKRDPWFELKPVRVESAAVTRGTMRRMYGSYAGEVPNWEEFFLERCDGCLSPEEATVSGGNDTFLASMKRP